MRYLLKVHIPVERGNILLSKPRKFGEKMQQLLTELQAEAAYFTAVNGQRGGYLVVNLEDASQIAASAEPLLFWLQADVEWMPVMLPQDLAKAGPAIETAVTRWG